MKEIIHQLQNKTIRQVTKRAISLWLHVSIPFITKEFLDFHTDKANPEMILEGYSLPAITFHKEPSLNKSIFPNLHIRGVFYEKYFAPDFLKIWWESSI